GSNSLDFLHYFECRPMTDNAFLLVEFLAISDNYADDLADYQDVMDTLSLEGGSSKSSSKSTPTKTSDNGNIFSQIGKENTQEETPTPTEEATSQPTEASAQTTQPKLTSTKYTGGAYKWSVTWDKSIWTPEALDPQDNYE